MWFKRYFTALCLLSIWGAPALANSMWTLDHRELSANLNFSREVFSDFWRGSDFRDLPANLGEITQQNVFMNVSYGWSNKLTFDAAFGWVQGKTKFGDSTQGLGDIDFGATYQFTDQFNHPNPSMPTIAGRIGTRIKGTYTRNLPYSPGDGANAIDAAIRLEKYSLPIQSFILGQFGYRIKSASVPDELFYSTGLVRQFGKRVAVSLEYNGQYALSGGNIGGTNITFAETQEIAGNIGLQGSYVAENGLFANLTFATTIHGKNTAKKYILSAHVGMPLNNVFGI